MVGTKALTLPLLALASGLRQSPRPQSPDHAGKIKSRFRFGPEWVGRQERIVDKSHSHGSPGDPFERASHPDDWIASVEERLLDLSGPVYVRPVDSTRNNCMLLSQVLRDGRSTLASSLRGGPEQCLQPRRSCAVVGSSEHLLNASFGSLIDEHDVVIRMNAAPSSKASSQYGGHVGTRTDVRFVNMYGPMPEEELARPLCVFLPQPKMPRECGRSCWRNPGFCNVTCSRLNMPQVCTKTSCSLDGLTCTGAQMAEEIDLGGRFVFLDSLNGAVADQVVPHSTAGFKAVIYAMSICEKVSVLGFGPSCDGTIGERYYHKGRPPAYFHHYDEELMLLRRASGLGPKVLAPPAARGRLRAKSVEVLLPSCVGPATQEDISSLFQRFGERVAVNLLRRS